MNKIIFVRHGQSQANADNVFAANSSPLTELGREQALQTAEEIRDFGIDLIVCSPYTRTQQTASIIANYLGINKESIKTLPHLRERIFQNMEGKPIRHTLSWYATADNLPGLETRQHLLERMQACLTELRQLSKDHTVLAVGHGTAGFYLLQAAKGKASVDELDDPSQLPNAGYAVIG